MHDAQDCTALMVVAGDNIALCVWWLLRCSLLDAYQHHGTAPCTFGAYGAQNGLLPADLHLKLLSI